MTTWMEIYIEKICSQGFKIIREGVTLKRRTSQRSRCTLYNNSQNTWFKEKRELVVRNFNNLSLSTPCLEREWHGRMVECYELSLICVLY